MLRIPALLSALVVHAGPQPGEPVAGPADASWTIRHDAAAERRHRLTTGVARVSGGALQTALGLYVLLWAPGRNDQVRTSGILNTAAGGGLILHGTLGLARRGPLESLVRRPSFKALDDSSESRQWLLTRVREAARRGRIERYLAGSLSVVAGLTIVGLGIANLADPDVGGRPAQTVLGATEVAAGLGFTSSGVGLLFVPSQAEHTLAAIERGRARGDASRRAQARVVPTFRGIAVVGRF